MGEFSFWKVSWAAGQYSIARAGRERQQGHYYSQDNGKKYGTGQQPVDPEEVRILYQDVLSCCLDLRAGNRGDEKPLSVCAARQRNNLGRKDNVDHRPRILNRPKSAHATRHQNMGQISCSKYVRVNERLPRTHFLLNMVTTPAREKK